MAKIEIYSKDWCPYCAKAKALLRSKHLQYQEIDITSDENLAQEMVERSQRRTVPQIFINGKSIGGYNDLAHLNAQGSLDKLLGLANSNNIAKLYDVVIVGAGPAGMSAAIYAARKNLSTLLLAGDIGGQIGTTAEVANYPGINSVLGPDLVDQFANHMEDYNVDKRIGERVVAIQSKQHHKVVKTAAGKKIHTRSVILATGASKRKINVPGEKKLAGKGVVYCSTCDGQLFKGMPIAIVGGGNSGLEAAIEMASISPRVYLLSKGGLTGDEILQTKVRSANNVAVLTRHAPVEIHGENQVEAITVQDLNSNTLRKLEVEGVFIEIGLLPNTKFTSDLITVNKYGEIEIDENGHTNVDGIFAAGDATNQDEKQIIVAAGSGANAALTAFKYLAKQA